MEAENIHIYSNERLLSEGITGFFKRHAEATAGGFNMALSGGNTPRIWFDYLAAEAQDWAFWPEVRFFWGDERCVRPDSEDSNYGLAKRHLFGNIDAISEQQVYRMQGELDPEEAAALYRKVLQRQLPQKDGLPKFDLVVLGLGSDGHTASIFPGQLDLWDNSLSCFATVHPGSEQDRITLSGGVINNADVVAFLVQGAAKAEIINEICNRLPGYHRYPAAQVDPKREAVHWFMDRSAAKHVNP